MVSHSNKIHSFGIYYSNHLCGWVVFSNLIEASLSEPQISETALQTCMYMFACLVACGHVLKTN